MSNNYIQLKSWQLKGVTCEVVTVEALLSRGLAQLRITGLPDSWLRDSREKIQALASHLEAWNALERILLHILPADEIKNGAHLELALSLACLLVLYKSELSEKSRGTLEHHTFIGHLSLEGKILSTPLIDEIYAQGHKNIVGPREYSCLGDLWHDLIHKGTLKSHTPIREISKESLELFDPIPFHGRLRERQLIALAYIAKVPVLLMGNPGVGKSKLARWAYSLLVLWDKRQPNSSTGSSFPYIAPHNRSTLWEFLGSQRNQQAQLGIFARAHGGLLVLDEFAELNRDVREILRTILDQKKVQNFSRGRATQFPADFWLVATSNPCPCGKSQPLDLTKCTCLSQHINHYSTRISGPLFDRFGVKLFLSDQNAHQQTLPSLPSEISEWDPKVIKSNTAFHENELIPFKRIFRQKHPHLSERSLHLKASILNAYSKLSETAFDSPRLLEILQDLITEEESLLIRRKVYNTF